VIAQIPYMTSDRRKLETLWTKGFTASRELLFMRPDSAPQADCSTKSALATGESKVRNGAIISILNNARLLEPLKIQGRLVKSSACRCGTKQYGLPVFCMLSGIGIAYQIVGTPPPILEAALEKACLLCSARLSDVETACRADSRPL